MPEPRSTTRAVNIQGDQPINNDELEQLLEVTGVTERKAEDLLEEYGNLYTVSWAATHDQDHIHTEFQIKAEFLREKMMEAGIWQDYWNHKKDLEIPDRRDDWYEDVEPDEKQIRWSEYQSK